MTTYRVCLGIGALTFLLGVSVAADGPLDDALTFAGGEYEFDCTSQSLSNTFVALGGTLIVPNGFEASPSDSSTYILKREVRSEFGPYEIPAITIHFGRFMNAKSSHWQEIDIRHPRYSDIAIRVHRSKLSNGYWSYQAAYKRIENELQVTSMVPIAWGSFLECIVE